MDDRRINCSDNYFEEDDFLIDDELLATIVEEEERNIYQFNELRDSDFPINTKNKISKIKREKLNQNSSIFVNSENKENNPDLIGNKNIFNPDKNVNRTSHTIEDVKMENNEENSVSIDDFYKFESYTEILEAMIFLKKENKLLKERISFLDKLMNKRNGEIAITNYIKNKNNCLNFNNQSNFISNSCYISNLIEKDRLFREKLNLGVGDNQMQIFYPLTENKPKRNKAEVKSDVKNNKIDNKTKTRAKRQKKNPSDQVNNGLTSVSKISNNKTTGVNSVRIQSNNIQSIQHSNQSNFQSNNNQSNTSNNVYKNENLNTISSFNRNYK